MHRVKVFISTDGTESNGYTFNDNYIKEITYSNQLLDSTFDITPTVIEQYAKIVFKDKNNLIYDLVVSEVLTKDLKVFVYIDNNLYQTYLTSSWDLRAQSSTITLYCNDEVKKLENIQTQIVNVSSRSLYTLFQLGFNWAGYQWECGDLSIRSLLDNIVIAQSYVSFQDLLTYFKKLCLVGFLRVYWYKDKFVIARCY